MSNTDKPLARSEVFYGLAFIGFWLVVLVAVLIYRHGGWSSQDTKVTGPPQAGPVVSQADSIEVVRVEIDGAPYLIWPNGQVTPDMAAHRTFIVRTMAAQALLQQGHYTKDQE